MGSQRHARADRARRSRHRPARGRASLSVAPSLRVVAGDPRLRARIEDALAAQPHGELIVIASGADVATLRAANPLAALVVVAAGRAASVAALDAGADCVIPGALRPAELRARVRALARRHDAPHVIGPLTLDRGRRAAVLDGVQLHLAPLEFALLCCLASAPGRVFTKAELIAGCWGSMSPASRTLERHAARLRSRLGSRAPMLVTVWGIGYRLDEPA